MVECSSTIASTVSNFRTLPVLSNRTMLVVDTFDSSRKPAWVSIVESEHVNSISTPVSVESSTTLDTFSLLCSHSLYDWVHVPMGSSVTRTFFCVFPWTVNTPRVMYPPSHASIVPVKPRYDGTRAGMARPLSRSLVARMTSRTQKLGIWVLNPVPIPFAPFTNTMGMIGAYRLGCTVCPSSVR